MQVPQCGQLCPPSCSGSACSLGLEGTTPPAWSCGTSTPSPAPEQLTAIKRLSDAATIVEISLRGIQHILIKKKKRRQECKLHMQL